MSASPSAVERFLVQRVKRGSITYRAHDAISRGGWWTWDRSLATRYSRDDADAHAAIVRSQSSEKIAVVDSKMDASIRQRPEFWIVNGRA